MARHVEQLQSLLSSLPLDAETQRQAEELVRACSEQELSSLGLGAPSKPVVPRSLDKLPVRQRLAAVQRVISSIEYNHKPGYFYNVTKDRPFCRIMDTAREVLREALPIKCIEAVFLGGLLTAGWSGVQRMPLGFKSKVNGEDYRHIVLVVHHTAEHKWGALGISRRQELMYKDLVFDSLSDLVLDFKQSYEKWWHTLQKARIGLPFEHDASSTGSVCWRYCSVTPSRHQWAHCAKTLDAFADDYKMIWGKFKVLGYAPGKPSMQEKVHASNHSPRRGNLRSTAASAALLPASKASTSKQPRFTSPSRRRGPSEALVQQQGTPRKHPQGSQVSNATAGSTALSEPASTGMVACPVGRHSTDTPCGAAVDCKVNSNSDAAAAAATHGGGECDDTVSHAGQHPAGLRLPATDAVLVHGEDPLSDSASGESDYEEDDRDG